MESRGVSFGEFFCSISCGKPWRLSGGIVDEILGEILGRTPWWILGDILRRIAVRILGVNLCMYSVGISEVISRENRVGLPEVIPRIMFELIAEGLSGENCGEIPRENIKISSGQFSIGKNCWWNSCSKFLGGISCAISLRISRGNRGGITRK